MNIAKKVYCRCFQTAFRIALPALPYKNPEVKTKIADIPEILRKNNVKKPIVITDGNLSALGAADNLLKVLKDEGFEYKYFDRVFSNPATDLAYEAADCYREGGCDCIIAYGGGSPMDLAKAAGVCISCPNRKLEKMAGILKVRKKIPLLIAVPTTAGTGSETTLAAVLISSKTRHKFAINDFPLIPKYAVLDPDTIHTLPTDIAASTGLDALTHAIEAYIGRSTTKCTRADAIKAVSLIFENLDAASLHESVDAEKKMLIASHYAGRAFTRSYVGYVHAVSHSLSGRYNLPHGLTNAIILPVFLRHYGSRIWKKLAELAIAAKLGDKSVSDEILAEKFISAIEEKNRKYDIPDKIDAIIESDIPMLAAYADKEANPLYPVPVLMDARELEDIYRKLMNREVKKDGKNGD